MRLVILSVLALVTISIGFYVLVTRIQYEQKVAQEALTYARIETYVNTAKVYLEQELPDGGWEIEKYCDAPNSKGSFDEYMCVYGVVATRDLGDMENLKRIGQGITGDQNVYLYPDHPSFSFNTETDQQLPKSCNFYSWEDHGQRLATVQCDAGSVITRYELRDL